MTEARGVHAHPDKKLGARPEEADRPKVAFGSLLKAFPPHPTTDSGPALQFNMDRNDQAGVCVVAGFDHAMQVQHFLLGASYTPMTDDEILADYQSQNPDFRSWNDAGSDTDRGMVIAKYLAYLVKRHRILGFAKVDHTKPEEVRAAVYLGLCLLIGSNLQEAQQQGTVWDFVPGSPDWGGHCTAEDGFDVAGMQTISWGTDEYRITDACLQKRVGEVYFVITQALVDQPGFRDHISLETFAERFHELTGRTWTYSPTPPPAPPEPAPPAPGPTPPNPGGDGWFQVAEDVLPRLARGAVQAGMSEQDYLNHRLRKYYKLPDA